MPRLGPLAALALAAALPASAEEEIGVGLPAPAFTLRTLNGDACGAAAVSLDALAGAAPEDPGSRLVLISFFASWCGPCKKELPFLEALHRRYRADGLRVLAVTVDRDEAGIADARRLATASRVTFPVLLDRFNLLARRYLGEQSPLPSVFLVARDGTLLRVERGYGEGASSFLAAEVQKALGAAPRTARAPGASP